MTSSSTFSTFQSFVNIWWMVLLSVKIWWVGRCAKVIASPSRNMLSAQILRARRIIPFGMWPHLLLDGLSTMVFLTRNTPFHQVVYLPLPRSHRIVEPPLEDYANFNLRYDSRMSPRFQILRILATRRRRSKLR